MDLEVDPQITPIRQTKPLIANLDSKAFGDLRMPADMLCLHSPANMATVTVPFWSMNPRYMPEVLKGVAMFP